MEKISICIKTYRRDLAFFETLAESLEKFNQNRIPVVVVCPSRDLKLFESRLPDSRLIADEELVPKSRSIRGLSEGYITAELAKLNFYRLGFSENVLFVDNDSKFVREFGEDDFFDNSGNLYSILTQDKDLIIDPSYRSYSIPRTRDLQRIYETLQISDSRLLQIQMNALVSCKVLAELMEDVLPSLGLDQFQALEISPFEYNWYSIWLQKSKLIPIIPIEPLFKTFHVREQYVSSLINGINEEDISRAYIGVVYNSTWFRRYQNETRLQRLILDFKTDRYYTRHARALKKKFSSNKAT